MLYTKCPPPPPPPCLVSRVSPSGQEVVHAIKVDAHGKGLLCTFLFCLLLLAGEGTTEVSNKGRSRTPQCEPEKTGTGGLLLPKKGSGEEEGVVASYVPSRH